MTTHAARKAIQNNMADAINRATGLSVEVTLLRDTALCVAGDDAAVVAARPVMELAGAQWLESETDDEYPGQRFDRYAY
jgi:hypothetical protein